MSMIVANFSGGEAEELRRAMGMRRSQARMRELEVKLRQGMTANGIRSEATSETNGRSRRRQELLRQRRLREMGMAIGTNGWLEYSRNNLLVKSIYAISVSSPDGWALLQANIASHSGCARIQRLELSSPEVVLSRLD
jgi:hypothetical protein